MLLLSPTADPETIDEIASRLRVELERPVPGCGCQGDLHAALQRFSAHEQVLERQRRLVEARNARDVICGLLDLLVEIDEIDATEPDKSAFHELHLLFRDIEAAASRGAELLANV